MLKACVDVDYREGEALAACLTFQHWADSQPLRKITRRVAKIAEYEPGQFYKRELPCLLAVLRTLGTPLELVIVDGYVWLGDESRPGLGAHLYEALGRTVPVIGVAKTQFLSAALAVAVHRGETATKELFVTAAGMDVHTAAEHIRTMHGSYRVPSLLKMVDGLCRGHVEADETGESSADEV